MIVNAAKMLFKRTTIKPIAAFSSGKWKEREDAAENLYVNQTEKQLIKKLLRKMESEGEDALHFERKRSTQEFERQLKVILARYKIENPGLEAELNRIHKEYSNPQ